MLRLWSGCGGALGLTALEEAGPAAARASCYALLGHPIGDGTRTAPVPVHGSDGAHHHRCRCGTAPCTCGTAPTPRGSASYDNGRSGASLSPATLPWASRGHDFSSPLPIGPAPAAAAALWQPVRHAHFTSYYASTVPYSRRTGQPAPRYWPEFEKVKAPSAFKWQRSVVRFPLDTSVALSGRRLTVSGQAGSLTLDLQQLDPTGLVGFQFVDPAAAAVAAGGTAGEAGTGAAAAGGAGAGGKAKQVAPAAAAGAAPAGAVPALLLLASPHKARLEAVVAEVGKAVRGATSGHLVGLTVKGVGYRLEPVDDPVHPRKWYFENSNYEKSNVTYPHPRPAPAVRLKVGFSRTAVFPLPPGVRAFFVKPTLMYLYGLAADEVAATAAAIRSIRKPNVYTGNGIQLVGETVRIKQRSGSK